MTSPAPSSPRPGPGRHQIRSVQAAFRPGVKSSSPIASPPAYPPSLGRDRAHCADRTTLVLVPAFRRLMRFST